MLDARYFGVKSARDFYYGKNVSQGRWTRCLDCMREAGIDPLHGSERSSASKTKEAEMNSEAELQQGARCKRCVERDVMWKQSLKPNAHGCMH